MKSKQYSLKVLEVEVEDEQETIAFFEKNYILFQNHLISLKGKVTDNLLKLLKSKKLSYIVDTNLPKAKVTKVEQKEEHEKLRNSLVVIDKIIRSGQEIVIDGDLLLLNRVNSGAVIRVSGNLIISRIVEGSIYCNGEFMMLVASPKANIIFNGVEVDNSYLKDKLNRIELKNNEIIITPVIKKEINWA